MNTKWIDEVVLEAISSGMSKQGLIETMKRAGAHESEIEQAVRELRAARTFDDSKFREICA